GVISTALKREQADPALVATAITVMTTLNGSASEAALACGVRAATDVTGFGLLGHLREMCVGSGVGAIVEHSEVPVIDGVRDLVARGMVAGGTQRNHAFVAPDVDFGTLPEAEQFLLADAQTSGGLLLAVPAEGAAALVAALEARGTLAAAVIGRTTEPNPGRIEVR
ncbi:MAG: selenide, water dikinase SelD, partial [Actinomycetota bacterium]|nr:selenide, water dikinase SelD [Actinomycetota bacterium]